MIKKITFLIVGLLAFFITIQAQTYIGKQDIIIQSDANGATSTYSADLDGDGDMDVLSASYYDDKIAWYENTDGNGNFGAQHVITKSADDAYSVYSADLDGDGDMDVLSASYGDDKIAWYENTDGNGNFGAQQVITKSADDAYSVYSADLDGDGDMDVLSASSSDDKIAWYENTDGNGTFGTQQVITTSASVANSVYSADLDGDGDMDVLSASYGDDKIAWYENTDGNGTFGTQHVITTNAAWARSVYSADLDGDGDMDVLSASSSNDKIAWYENTDGNGTFGAQQVITTSADGAYSVYSADLDDDGDMDVLSASSEGNKIAWYENTDGNATFGTQQVITTSADGARSVYSADLDSDGDMDVLSASRFDDKIAWYENTDGNATFEAQKVITPCASDAKSVYSADLDNDGDMDVLSASSSDDKIAWYENTDSNATFGKQQVITTNAAYAESVYSVDLDGDGDKDGLSVSGDVDKIAWYENTDGNATFGSQQVITTYAAYANSLYFADLDGDGDMDVLSASSEYNKIAWYENTDGNGTFGKQQVITTNAEDALSVYSADLDGDGDKDVLSASRNDDKIAWYENIDGNATFGKQQVITTNADFTISVYSADLDGDGDKDVLSASRNDDKIAWYENTDGNGTFGKQQVITTNADFAMSVYSADLDGDGDKDVLSASRNDDKIAWYENTDGNATFGRQQVITTSADGAGSVYSADLDGDSDMDVLSASHYDDKIAWYENFTLEIITQPQNQTVCPNSSVDFSISAKDIDDFQWQVNEGSDFVDLSDDAVYSDVTTNTLTINEASRAMSGYIYRCVLSNQSGSANSNEAVLTVEDNTNPEITCVGNQEVDTNETNYYTVQGTEFDPIEISDNCGVDNVKNDFNNQSTLDGAQIPEGTTTIVWTITDNAGNTTNCSFDIVVNDYVGVETIKEAGITIDPNPTTGVVNFEFADNTIQKISISDITGKQIIEKTEIKQNESIDLSAYEDGIYIISIQTDKEKITQKIIKE